LFCLLLLVVLVVLVAVVVLVVETDGDADDDDDDDELLRLMLMLMLIMMMMVMMMMMLLIRPCTFWPAGPLLGVSPLNRASRPCRSAKPPAEGRSFSYTAAAPCRRPTSDLRCFLLFDKNNINRKKKLGGVPPRTNMAPRWAKMSPKMAQLRPNMAPRWLNIGPR